MPRYYIRVALARLAELTHVHFRAPLSAHRLNQDHASLAPTLASDREGERGPERLVSVILPTFNRAHFLPEAFASIAAQSFSNWELIVVDDGSTDDTESVVRAWARAVT